MNTTIDTEVKVLPQKSQLPPLIKQSSTYKLIVPAKVEEKIRYLCRKFPSLEWSGILFYKHTGSFEDDNLVVTCEDLYPMDLGSATYTEFKSDSTVTNYIVDHIELFDCDMGLIHSHNRMQCWLSGTDTATLRSEGNDTNCFVSLIVNNEGTYCAAITRKVVTRTETQVIGSNESYEFFGEGAITSESIVDPSETVNIEERTEIQYFMLDVEREEVTNHLDYLDARFEEIEAKKRANSTPVRTYPTMSPTGIVQVPDQRYAGNDYDKDEDFYDWIHSNRKQSAETKEALLFDKKTMDDMVEIPEWAPDPTIIHYLTIQLITCSLIVSKDLDLRQWVVKWMTKKYDEIFKGTDEVKMDNWADFYVEFILNHYDTHDVPLEIMDDYDEYTSKIALAILGELDELPKNAYIEVYKTKLTMYVV